MLPPPSNHCTAVHVRAPFTLFIQSFHPLVSPMLLWSRIRFCVRYSHFSQLHIPRSVIAGPYGNFNFLKKLPNCFPKWLHPFTFPPAIHETFSSSTFSSFFIFQLQLTFSVILLVSGQFVHIFANTCYSLSYYNHSCSIH